MEIVLKNIYFTPLLSFMHIYRAPIHMTSNTNTGKNCTTESSIGIQLPITDITANNDRLYIIYV